MNTSSVEQTLEELRLELARVEAEVGRAQAKLSDLETRQFRLSGAIQSLELLKEPGAVPNSIVPDSTVPDTTEAPDLLSGLGDEQSDAPLVPEDSPVARYLLGEGRRLSSTAMVVDLLKELDRTVSRDEFKAAFFDKFPRAHMELIWANSDNAVTTALLRAAKDKLIAKGRRNNGTDVYASLAVVERIRQRREKAASSDPDAEEQG